MAFFSTAEQLVPGDTDIRRDVYERSFDTAVGDFVTRQVSFGPTGGNNAFDAQFIGNDPAGDRAYFSTSERLTAADADGAPDIYVRDLAANRTTLVSAGDPSCAASGCGTANAAAAAVTDGIAADGDRVFFASEERLAPGDADSAADVFVRDLSAGTTTLVSGADPSCTSGGCGNGPDPAFFLGASADGRDAVIATAGRLRDDDADGTADVYLRDLAAGATRLVSEAGTCPPELEAGACVPVIGSVAISADGSHVLFESKDRIDAADTDAAQDVYDWSAGTATLASLGPAGGNGVSNALYSGRSADGSRVFFETDESLTAGDTDSSQDVYARIDGTATALVSAGAGGCAPGCGNGAVPAALRWLSPDGATAVISTVEPLAPGDEDDAFDVYRRDLGAAETTLVSRPGPSCEGPGCGNAELDANFAGASAGGSRIFFVTPEALVPPDPEEPLAPGDGDERTDVYARALATGTTELISAADPSCGSELCGNGPYDAQLHGASADGTRAFFVTAERLTPEDDFAGEDDVYSRRGGTTLLVSRGNDDELESALAPPAPALERTDPASPGASTEPRIVGSEPEAAASIKVYTTPDCAGEPVATGTATELADPGIAAPAAAGETTAFRATAEAEGFTSGCSAPISYRQEDPSPPEEGGGAEGGSGGGSGGGDSGSGSGGDSGSGASEEGGGSSGGSEDPTSSAGGAGGARIHYVAPVTRITFGPAFKTRWRRPAFRFADGTGQPGTRFICRVDRRRWRFCGSPVRLRALRRGVHVFKVKGVNAAGAWQQGVVRRRFRMTRADVRGLALRRARLERRRRRR